MELVIVLVIIWILTIFSLWISNGQIQKVKNKTVKESILAERQSRYSRNLWSSSFSWTIYKHMDIILSWWSNEIKVQYYTWDKAFLENSFSNRFSIEDITWDTNQPLNNVTLEYTPYRIACKIKESDTELMNKIILKIKVNDQENGNYCFEINSNNCRLIEVPGSRCWIEPI